MIDFKTTLAPLLPSVEKVRRKPPLSRVNEAQVWEPLSNGWRQLFGGFYESGISIEWHDFRTEGAIDWARSFHPESLELCLNLTGQGLIQSGQSRLNFEPSTAGFYIPGDQKLTAWRNGSQQHRFLTIEFSRRFLRQRLAASDGRFHPVVEAFINGGAGDAALGNMHRLTIEQEQLITQLVQPPTCQAARGLWYQSKVLQLMVDFFFERPGAEELFCDRQKRVARERAEGVVALLRQNLTEPPNLERIGREIGCSPFYLSRIFSREMGMSIPQYLRKIRMERAAQLLAGGTHNVTEAAFEVGYSSLSHFSQAFCQTIGCCPALYPRRLKLIGLP